MVTTLYPTRVLTSDVTINFNDTDNNKIIKDKKDYPYTPKEWMVKFLKLDESYIDQMFEYLKKSIISFFIENPTTETTRYREYIKLCVSDKILLNEEAEYIDLSETLDAPPNIDHFGGISEPMYSKKNLSGFLRFLILHYEEDKLVETISKKYNIENKAIQNLLKCKTCKKEDTAKSFFELLEPSSILQSDTEDELNTYKIFNVVKSVFSYNYNKKTHILCVGEHESAYFMAKCSTNMDNPALKYIQNYFESGNFVINIISGNHKIVKNLNGFDMLVLDNGSWYLP